ncbi:MAG: DUF5063 domain-containing protein [Bacteroidales bacterium]|jgi:hypothetical protein|nr:DUF5063 domain-containing protein [Bacteroidales bacterium]
MPDKPLAIYDKNTVEFVTVAFQFCNFIETAGEMTKEALIDKFIKIIPLLYLKATLLPQEENLYDEETETFVTEYGYESVRTNLLEKIGADDDYLEVFSPDIFFSDTPVTASISENLADIYQDVKNFVSVYALGFEETMHSALLVCRENFETFWGQKAVNVLRPLHAVKYGKDTDDE